VLAGGSVSGVVNDNMVGAIGVGLATCRECTSIKGAEQLVPGSIQVMSASTGSVSHVLDYMDQTLLEGILRLSPSVRHLKRIGFVHHGSTVGEHRAIECDGTD